MKGENLRVELFGEVKPHHSPVLNHQLQQLLKKFDKTFRIEDGKLGHLLYQQDRMEFSRMVCQHLIHYAANVEGNITELETVQKFHSSERGKTYKFTAKSKFDSDAVPNSTTPFFEPN
ncbi:MAG: hypothetical protein GC192_21440 [Bacteroidetes bacterium]|nr:hypothetical protein [Bacteroidota bacterium]